MAESTYRRRLNKEMRENKEPIGRPRQVYTGYQERAYNPMSNR